MPKDFFDAPLRRAAQQLIDLGEVSDVRVLQNGRVVTGIAGDRQRVYIQYRSAGTGTLEAECSCSEPNPCVHVAAVAMAAAEISGAPESRRTASEAPTNGEPSRQASASGTRGPPRPQSLCYLIELDDAQGARLSAWITQTAAGAGNLASQACRFALRIPEGSQDYPRYVDAQDRGIIDALRAQQVLTGAAGFDLLQRALATGRAFWRSLQGRALHEGGAREMAFGWQSLPNGDQRLLCDTSEALDFLLDLEPAVYIDTASGMCGPLDLPYPVELLRRYWNRVVIDPAQVCALNAQLGREPRASRFPRLREIIVREQALSSLRPRLILSAGAVATLQFLYNGKAIDADSLRADDPCIRRREGDVVYQISRDYALERQLRAQLDGCLTSRMRDGAAWLEFMMNGAPALRAAGWEISVDPRFPYRVAESDEWYADLQTPAPAQAHHPRGARRSREWFDLRVGVMVDGRAVNVLPALVDYLQATTGRGTAGPHESLSLITPEHLLIRLEDGRYLPVPMARIQRITDALVELFDRDALNEHQALSLRTTQAGILAQLALGPNAPALQSNDPTLRHLIAALEDFSHIAPVAAPANFPATLRPYQAEGLAWLQFLRSHGLGGILADDMGLGKTVQTLAHLLIEKQQDRLRKPSLIVAPVSVLGNWQQEIRRFAPELSLLLLHGPKREESFAAIGTADIVIIGYPRLLLDSDWLLEREFYYVILDEAQTIKNPRAKVSQVARALQAEHRLCLTGTPMENHLGDLWSLFDFVQPGLLGERPQFERHYRTPIETGGDRKRAATLRSRIAPFLLRRTKDAVAQDLPPKIEIVQAIQLDERQRDFYDGIRLGQHRRVRELIEEQGLSRSHITVLDALLKLRQACCDPRLVSPDAHVREIPSAKLSWLTTTLPELIEEGRRIVVFSQFTSMLRLIETAVKALSIPHVVLTGETRQRTELVNRFQAGDVPLFLISLKAGGTGLNLTGADTIIHYDPWWNPAVEAQATDRAHRIGQNKSVFVYKLIAQRTVEEKITQLQADKHALVTRLYADHSASLSQLSSADVETLFAA